jgi:hypothetical protein
MLLTAVVPEGQRVRLSLDVAMKSRRHRDASEYDESTVSSSGDTYDVPPCGLDGGITPWDAGMIPVPEPSAGSLPLFGSMGLAGLWAMKRSI